MKKIVGKYKIIIIAVLLYAVFFFIKRELFFTAVNNTWRFILEMLQVMPPVLVISALITVWVPSDIIKKGLGRDSGLRGKLLSLIIGSVSAGPIYAAFPAVLVLFKKGASISNMVIILSAWAVVKVPMLLVETSFLGIRFVLTRLAFTVPAILIMGYLTEKLVRRGDIKAETKDNKTSPKDLVTSLPNLNCGGCGYDTCMLFAEAVADEQKKMTDCIVLRKQTGTRELANA